MPIINKYINALGEEWKSYQCGGILPMPQTRAVASPAPTMRDDLVVGAPLAGARPLDGQFGIDTIYVGGGTPSLLDVDMWERLDDTLFSRMDKSDIREWSVECNPDSFTIEKARAYAKSGVTRLTFGVQSLDERELSICGRAHSSNRAFEVLSDARLADMFDSIGVDIIYGLPGQTLNTLDDTLSRILSIPHIKHLSAYELTVADDTPFGRHKKILTLPDDDIISKQYESIGKRARERGMLQYEVSNYALPGFESVHNSAYWTHVPYIGLGASAHSYIHPKRWGNVCDIDRYISSCTGDIRSPDAGSEGTPPAADFVETLTPADLAHEMIFLGLRHTGGIDISEISSSIGIGIDEEHLQRFVSDGLLQKSSRRYVPTPRGMLFADMMARELISCAD